MQTPNPEFHLRWSPNLQSAKNILVGFKYQLSEQSQEWLQGLKYNILSVRAYSH